MGLAGRRRRRWCRWQSMMRRQWWSNTNIKFRDKIITIDRSRMIKRGSPSLNDVFFSVFFLQFCAVAVAVRIEMPDHAYENVMRCVQWRTTTSNLWCAHQLICNNVQRQSGRAHETYGCENWYYLQLHKYAVVGLAFVCEIIKRPLRSQEHATMFHHWLHTNFTA